MKLDEIIDSPFVSDTEKELWKYIKRDCQPFLQSVKNPIALYRGILNYTGAFMKKKVRLNNRTPLAMLKKQHDIINDVFIEKFGEPFRNAVFVIGESKMYRTDMFGPTFLIFPIGNFTFLWSPTVIDLNHKFDNEILIPSPGRPLKNLIMQFKNNLQNLSYTTENFETAIESGHEIMIRSKEYYAVSVEYYDINLLRRKLK